MTNLYRSRHVRFDDCDAMASVVLETMDERADFKAMQVTVDTCGGLKGLMARIGMRQRDAMVNGYEPRGVRSSELTMFREDGVGTKVLWTDKRFRPVRTRDVDRYSKGFLESVGIRPKALADIGLVVCGGCLVECALSDVPMTRAEAHDLLMDTGFDIDLFVTGDVPYRGSVMAYADQVRAHLMEHRDINDVTIERRGFCADLIVRYNDGELVKMQVVDLGVAATPMQIVSSFDISVAKIYFDPTTSRVVMTEDAAYSFINGTIPFDRRYVEDPRYAHRLRKYVDRTGYSLLVDDLGRGCARVVDRVAERVRHVFATNPEQRRERLSEVLCSWLEEMPVSDANVLAWSILGRYAGKGSCRGYSTKKRVIDCPQLTGMCGRFGLRPIARKGDPLTELHAMFLLCKIVRGLALITS